MIPTNIKKQHLRQAIAQIDQDSTPDREKSTKYDLVYKGKLYPPKLVVRVANRIVNGEDLRDFGGGEETNRFLQNHGFEIIRKPGTAPQEHMIEQYKKLVREGKTEDERYKWELIKQFQQGWDPDAADFNAMIRQIKFENLVYPMSRGALVAMAKDAPERLRGLFRLLYDEARGLPERIEQFSTDMEILFQELYSNDLNRHAYQDERQMATYLAFRFPDKYYIYKDSVYGRYCKFTGIKKQHQKNKKYVHYISLMDAFVQNYILKDQELLELAKGRQKKEEYPDPNYHLLAQDIVYLTLERFAQTNHTAQNGNTLSNLITMPALNTILYGPPGTGKTYSTIQMALRIADPDFLQTEPSREAMKQRFQELQEAKQVAFVTFHQSTSYEDFIEGIKPKTLQEEEQSTLSYDIEKGIFWRMANRARLAKQEAENASSTNDLSFSHALNTLKAELEASEEEGIPVEMKTKGYQFHITDINESHITIRTQSSQSTFDLPLRTIENTFYGKRGITRHGLRYYMHPVINKLKSYSPQTEAPSNTLLNHVLIIDEINRGNIAQIFGELITLLEEDKRDGKSEQLSVSLTYSKEPFSVPDNLYLIGTMNTADRSVEALDTALRRRFSFQEMPPKPELLTPLDDLDIPQMLETINHRIEILLDHDHRIGHAYFMHIASANDPLEALKETFQRNIIPLVQEYFYGDYTKIGAVLGEAFVQKSDKKIGPNTFTSGTWDIDATDYRPVYVLKDISKIETTEPFKSIYAAR